MRNIIAFTIDGTLFNDLKEITPRTKAALIAAQHAGHILVLVSGRPTSSLTEIAEALEMKHYHGLLLAYHGGVVIDCTTGHKLYEHAIPIETARRLVQHVQQYPIHPIIDDGYQIYTNHLEGCSLPYESESNHLQIKLVTDIAEAIDVQPAKVMITAPEEILSQHLDAIKQPFQEELSFIQSTPFYLEATSKGVNKVNSLQIICDQLQISKEYLIFFGNAQQDISMIQFAGTGVAMGNACDALKDCCTIITKSNNEDGIAIALEYLGVIEKVTQR